MRRMSMLALALAALVLAVAAAGCGGGSRSAATTEAVTTEAATTEAATTEAMTTEPATTEAATTTTSRPGFSAGKCRDLAESSQKLSAAFNATNGTDLKKEAALLQDFVKKVPAEIQADFQVLADYVSKVADVTGNLKAGERPDAQTLAKLQKLATEVNQAKLTQASKHVTAWVQKNCHA
jgi:ABC-type glycerol-3-phosphate transport system substrate-binding protein